MGHGLSDLQISSISLRRVDTNSADLPAILSEMAERLGDAWLGLCLLDAEGRPLAAVPAGWLPGLAPVPANGAGVLPVNATTAGVSDPYLDQAGGRPAATLWAPFTSTQDGRQYVLAAAMDLDHTDLLLALQETTGLGETGHAEIVDRRGLVIHSTDAAEFLSPGEHLEFYTRMLATNAESVETVPYEAWDGEEVEE